MPLLSASEIDGMREEVLDTSLDARCTVQRKGVNPRPEDPYGQKAPGWGNYLVNIRCHYWEATEEELVGLQNATVTTERLVLPAGTDVTTKDRIVAVTRIVDSVVQAEALEVIEVIDQLNQVLLKVKGIQ